MRKLNFALTTLLFCNTACFANFGFYLNNKTDTELPLISHKTTQGNLTLPSFLGVSASNVYGTSTSNEDMSKGSFAYGIDKSNYCEVKYNQDWNIFSGTYYKVDVIGQVGNVICFVSQDDKHKSQVVVNYFKM